MFRCLFPCSCHCSHECIFSCTPSSHCLVLYVKVSALTAKSLLLLRVVKCSKSACMVLGFSSNLCYDNFTVTKIWFYLPGPQYDHEARRSGGTPSLILTNWGSITCTQCTLQGCFAFLPHRNAAAMAGMRSHDLRMFILWKHAILYQDIKIS